MKYVYFVPYRQCDKRFKLKESYVVQIGSAKNGSLFLPIPDDIVKAYHIKIGDAAVFEVVNKDILIIRFFKKTMCSSVEEVI